MIALFLFVLQAFATCGAGAPACITAFHSYCSYNSGTDVLTCRADQLGANTMVVGGSGTSWDVTITDPAGTFCCDTTDWAGGGADTLAEFHAICGSSPDYCTFDLRAMPYPTVDTGSDGDDTFYGSDYAADTIFGSWGDDYIEGGAGNDTLYGEEDSDFIDGGSGADTLYAAHDSTDATASGGCNNILLGGSGNFADTLYGSAEVGAGCAGDYISAESGAGKDLLYGYAGADTLCGAGGNDELYGGAGDDYLYGDVGSDSQNCGPGNDRNENDATGLTACESTGGAGHLYTTSCPSIPTWP